MVPYQCSFEFDSEREATSTRGGEAPAAVTTGAYSSANSGSSPEIDYELRVSARAKRVSLRVVPGRGLVVTIPRRFARKHVPAVVEEHRDWALAALAKLDAQTPTIYREWPPRTLNLAAIQRRIGLVFVADDSAHPTDEPDGCDDVWELPCAFDDRARVASAIARALKPLAASHLGVLARQLAGQHGLSYRRLSVRGQRSVWGSYSSSGTLSLNYKLMFLRPDLVEYVVAHELAHTLHLDHSPAFWNALESINPDARALDSELSSAGRDVPPWLELAR